MKLNRSRREMINCFDRPSSARPTSAYDPRQRFADCKRQTTSRPQQGRQGKISASGLIEDVTERNQAEERVAYLAYHDMVTNLPNRPAFTERLASVLDDCVDSGRPFAVLSIDLDRFKEVNDVLGHSIGDALLREVSRRLQIASGNAFLARVGGDEFMVIASDDAQPSRAKVLPQIACCCRRRDHR